MIEYTASRLARQEHEERVRSMLPVDDYDVELKRSAGHWQAQPIGGLLLLIGQTVRSWSETLKPRQEPVEEDHLGVQEMGGVTG